MVIFHWVEFSRIQNSKSINGNIAVCIFPLILVLCLLLDNKLHGARILSVDPSFHNIRHTLDVLHRIHLCSHFQPSEVIKLLT